jgi:hypothetical protein
VLFRKLLLIASIVAMAVSTYAQSVPDAEVTLTVIRDRRPDHCVFDVSIKRTSDRWRLWGNGTFRMELPSLGAGLDSTQYGITLLPGTSQLPEVGFATPGMSGYHITPRFMNRRLSITVMGPDSAGDSYVLSNVGDSLLLGRFDLYTLNGSTMDNAFQFTSPQTHYQAHAFKIDHDSVTGSGSAQNVWYVRHDNVEMVTSYNVSPPPKPGACDSLIVRNFTGTYLGDLAVELTWDTDCEFGTAGFIIERALYRPSAPNPLDFTERLTFLREPALVTCSTCETGRSYSVTDGVEYRREIYAYRLISERVSDGAQTVHDTVFVRIPNSILSNGVPLENPFSGSNGSAVQFNVDDRLFLTAKIFDLGGRMVDFLYDEQGRKIENTEYAKGTTYRAAIKSAPLMASGMYNIVLVGKPFDDKSIEDQSRIVIKVQVMK